MTFDSQVTYTVGLAPSFNEFCFPLKLPFPKNDQFLGREDVIHEMQANFGPRDMFLRKTIILIGMGGLGKTQIALEYAYRFNKEYSAIFWLDSKSAETVNSSGLRILDQLVAHYATKHPERTNFTKIAVQFGIPSQLDASGHLVAQSTKKPWLIIKEWLGRSLNNNWLLVIDGHDDIDSGLSELIPSSKHGNIIITSRNRTVCTEVQGHILDVPELNTDMATLILVKIVDPKHEPTDLSDKEKDAAQRIVEKVG
ncbi:P-loop containing nucleoside triphosphate hydrolase protein [Pyronema domesticum]|nr:P-loop containing nucleoside triphosphate hydrolase protein [Pyronema domesticum]